MDIKINTDARDITINDIALALGVSKTTISRAISGKGRIGPKTKLRVLEYVKEHDYKPNSIAKSLAHSKSYNIGFVLPSDANTISTPFFQGCLMGVCESAASVDYDVVITTASENDITLLRKLVTNRKVDGFILSRSLVNDEPARYLKEVGLPYVIIGSSNDKNVVQVDNDIFTACQELTSILINSGNNKVAYIGGDQAHIVQKTRFNGYIQGFLESDKEIDRAHIYLNIVNKTQIDQTLNRILEQNVDCIITGDDLICNRVLTKLHSLNLSIPKDIKIASFYNSYYLDTHNPPITSININPQKLGITAANALIELLSGKSVQQKIMVNYEIRIKGSTL